MFLTLIYILVILINYVCTTLIYLSTAFFIFLSLYVAHHISVSHFMYRQLQNEFVVNQWASFMKLKQVNFAGNYFKTVFPNQAAV